MFIASRRSHVASEQVNSPVASMLRRLSLVPADENISIGGRSLTALKKLYGARLAMPSAPIVLTQPIGRGPTRALKGSWRRPWFLPVAS